MKDKKKKKSGKTYGPNRWGSRDHLGRYFHIGGNSSPPLELKKREIASGALDSAAHFIYLIKRGGRTLMADSVGEDSEKLKGGKSLNLLAALT